MSLCFRRRLKLLPGVSLNRGLHGAGVSVGPRGLHVGVNRRGMYTSAGIPGTGLYAVRHFKRGEDHEVTGVAGPFLIGVLIAIAIMIIGIAAGAGR